MPPDRICSTVFQKTEVRIEAFVLPNCPSCCSGGWEWYLPSSSPQDLSETIESSLAMTSASVPGSTAPSFVPCLATAVIYCFQIILTSESHFQFIVMPHLLARWSDDGSCHIFSFEGEAWHKHSPFVKTESSRLLNSWICAIAFRWEHSFHVAELCEKVSDLSLSFSLS